jgi:hypothetical protein
MTSAWCTEEVTASIMMANAQTAINPVMEVLSSTKSKTALKRGANSGQ